MQICLLFSSGVTAVGVAMSPTNHSAVFDAASQALEAGLLSRRLGWLSC